MTDPWALEQTLLTAGAAHLAAEEELARAQDARTTAQAARRDVEPVVRHVAPG